MSSSRFAGCTAFLLVCLSMSTAGFAGDSARFRIDEENDAFASDRDRHYTQGLSLTYTSADLAPDHALNDLFNGVAEATPIFANGGKRQYQLTLGQSLFTPDDTRSTEPLPNQRPYAGWLYTGLGLMQEMSDGEGLENLELQLGVIGPAALGRQAQNGYHHMAGIRVAHGWSHQLKNEPGLVLSYERKARSTLWRGEDVALDVIPEAGVSLGNVFTYAQAGGMVRFGRNLSADYGSYRIRPGMSGTTWFDSDRLDGDLGWYLFAGVQGRAVLRDITMDGNSFRDSPSVDRKKTVGDMVVGFSVFWSDAVRADLSVVERTREFKGQNGRDRFGVLALSFRL